jgi:hypothetical protein
MGLDQYAYMGRKGQRDQYWEEYELEADKKTVTKPEEIAYWRKHPNLQGWMEQLWKRKLAQAGQSEPSNDGWGSSFNGVELELTWDDLDDLEEDVKNGHLPSTQGFFFGEDSDNYYKQEDLEFISKARLALTNDMQVFYNSSW